MELSGKKIRKLFAHRWKIETFFREANRVKIRTSTKDPLMRAFFYAISCAIYNIWIKVRPVFRSKSKRNMTLNRLRSAFLGLLHKCAVAKGCVLQIIGIEG
jgi:IS4 transposase